MANEVSVVALIEANEGVGEAVQAAILPCVTASRQEPDNILYTVHVDREKTSRFVIIERWASADALEGHKSTPHFQTMVEALQPLIAQPIAIFALDELF